MSKPDPTAAVSGANSIQTDPETGLSCLVYASKANALLSLTDTKQLALNAAAFNETMSVTGYLYFNEIRGEFLQYLEGDAQGINAVYTRVRADARHRIIGVVKAADLGKRRFADWSMRLLNQPPRIVDHETLAGRQIALISGMPQSKVDLSSFLWRSIDRIAETRQ